MVSWKIDSTLRAVWGQLCMRGGRSIYACGGISKYWPCRIGFHRISKYVHWCTGGTAWQKSKWKKIEMIRRASIECCVANEWLGFQPESRLNSDGKLMVRVFTLKSFGTFVSGSARNRTYHVTWDWLFISSLTVFETHIDDDSLAVVVVVDDRVEVMLAGVLRVLVHALVLVGAQLRQRPARKKTK